jgi:hypothetical protein
MFKVCKPVAAQMCTAIENLSLQTASRTLFAPSFFNVDKFKEHSSYIQKKQGADKSNKHKSLTHLNETRQPIDKCVFKITFETKR